MSLAKRALKTAAAAADRVRVPPAGITILIYHRVGSPLGGEMTLDPGRFDEQLAWLTSTTRVLDLDQVATELAAPGPVEPGVALTFDDGSADWIDHVLPALERHGAPATWYVATGFVDDGRLPDGAPAATWSQLRDAATSRLVTLGSHTHHHLLLDRLAPAAIGAELDLATSRLQDETGVQPEHFAYPKAVPPSPPAAAAVRARFRTAVLAGTRANLAGQDLHRLARSPIQASDDQRRFRQKALGGLRLEDDLRQLANRVRYRGRTD